MAKLTKIRLSLNKARIPVQDPEGFLGQVNVAKNGRKYVVMEFNDGAFFGGKKAVRTFMQLFDGSWDGATPAAIYKELMNSPTKTLDVPNASIYTLKTSDYPIYDGDGTFMRMANTYTVLAFDKENPDNLVASRGIDVLHDDGSGIRTPRKITLVGDPEPPFEENITDEGSADPDANDDDTKKATDTKKGKPKVPVTDADGTEPAF